MPWPLQVRQVDMPVPGLAPEPSQVLQVASVGTSISTVRADEGFLEADLEIVAQVRAAQARLAAAAASASPPMKSPKMSSKMSDIEEPKSGPKPARLPGPAPMPPW